MNIYAIGDLHLSFERVVDLEDWENNSQHKPMEEIDSFWRQHARKIYENWNKIVAPGDVVLVPGDISWAMRLDEASHDLDFLSLFTGLIVCVQGNHDYWWQSVSRVRSFAPPNMKFIQNDYVEIGGLKFCGSRGWVCPNSSLFKEEDEKIYRRELIRMENSLRAAGEGEKVVLMHYMPTSEKHEYSQFVQLFEAYGVETVVYGHLHARACRYRLPDQAWGINFHLVSADFLGFNPKMVCSI
ncbi:MAG TPA: phosphohydrolase [Desulfotomaculum sp.]|nr:MAG: phosphohydrolase [Peptococcaceae bacterium BRH_c8a]KJS71239.1 MAG: phosphohydrolase [Desulfotomaculum sp. BICA1-6]HBX23856.1 phosphohydrolase [Desulfotomaculum sp.]